MNNEIVVNRNEEPEKVNSLKKILELNPDHNIPLDARGRIRWKILNNDSDLLNNALERIIEKYLELGGELTIKSLKKTAGMSDVIEAISHNYPAGFYGLRERFGVPNNRKPSSSWQSEEAKDLMLQMCSNIFTQGHEVTANSLKKLKRYDLVNAITKYFPGGFSGVRIELGIEDSRKQNNFWSEKKSKKKQQLIMKLMDISRAESCSWPDEVN